VSSTGCCSLAAKVFQVLSERHERGSLIVTTNLPFGEWTKVFPDPRLAKPSSKHQQINQREMGPLQAVALGPPQAVAPSERAALELAMMRDASATRGRRV
jgi:hypothetical protein